MRERADHLKKEVHHMFDAHNGLSVTNALILVDVLERLGIDNHFQEEIYVVLRRVHSDEEQEFGNSKELHIVGLRFRLLRQHGFFVSIDVFDKFKDSTGNFSTGLTGDPRGQLSLYNGAHIAVPGEDVLDDAMAFARSHLKAMKGNLGSPIAGQVARALDIALPRYMPQIETIHYIIEYEQEEAHNATMLELARLDYNLRRSTHLKELQTFCS
ncbi:hypothetical protein C2845_PM17G10310 [Panicum miliaceum]|uniref:Terpene synthase N-terminal domain-containing protein n=1 Tax=Panicum miliaceum TaxID=4540 RepID=A0A3L6Q0E0_PANMI|nr:hypothetical protein C2845_PM17G10310 [Panicum miliaceum]